MKKEEAAITGLGSHVTVHPFTYQAVQSIRATGKAVKQMITELLDNSEDADANKASVTILPTQDNNGKHIQSVIVADNGVGMDFDQLEKSYGISQTVRPRRVSDHGKFGMGGTLYTLTHFDKKQTITRHKGDFLVREYDMCAIEKNNRYHSVPVPFTTEHEALWNAYSVGKGDGTIIVLTDYIEGRNAGFTTHLGSTKNRVGIKYNQSITKGIFSVDINGERIEGICPTLKNHPKAKVTGNTVSFEKGGLPPFVVEFIDISGVSNAEIKLASGKTSQDIMSGFYFERNESMITEFPIWPGDGRGFPGTAKLGDKMAYDRKTRILVKFTSEHDRLFGIDNGKDTLQLDHQVAEMITEVVRGQIAAARASYQLGTNKATSDQVKRIGKEIAATSAKRHVKPKMGHGSNKGRKYERSGKYKNQNQEPFVKELKVTRLGATNSLYRRSDDGVLEINQDHRFYLETLRNASADSLELVSMMLLCLLSTETEMRYATEDVDLQTVNEFMSTLDKKLKNVS